MRKKTIRATLSMFLLIGILSANLAGAQAVQVEPRFTGIYSIYSSLTVSSSGAAKCHGSAETRNGYTVNLTVELKKDGDVIKTWESSGTGTVSAGGTYYVASGHEYVVTTTAEVCNSKGVVIETPEKDSLITNY